MAQTKIFGITVGKPSAPVKKENLPLEVKQAHTFTPQVPRVNLIPSEMTEKYEIKHLVRNFAAGAVIVAVLLGGAWGGGQYFISTQEAKLASLAQEQQALTMEAASLQPYQAYEVAVQAKRDLFAKTTLNDINMGLLYQDINDASAASQVDVRSLTVTQYEPGAEGADCVNPDPFATTVSQYAVSGCLVFNGGASSLASATEFFEQLEQEGDVDGDRYRNPYISSFAAVEVTDGEGAAGLPNQFTATMFFTDALYSNTFVDFFNSSEAEAAPQEEAGN